MIPRWIKAIIFAILGTILVVFWIPFMIFARIEKDVFDKLSNVLYDWYKK